jgi:hypothetical protein
MSRQWKVFKSTKSQNGLEQKHCLGKSVEMRRRRRSQAHDGHPPYYEVKVCRSISHDFSTVVVLDQPFPGFSPFSLITPYLVVLRDSEDLQAALHVKVLALTVVIKGLDIIISQLRDWLLTPLLEDMC